MLRYQISINSLIILFLIVGCAQKNEGFILKHITKKYLPEFKQEAKKKKDVLLKGQQCLHQAKTLQEANSCNNMMIHLDPDFEIEPFSKWTPKELQEVDTIAEEYIGFFDCILEAKTITDTTKCEEPKE